MTKQIQVIFEDGVFKPVDRIDWLDEHRQVTVTIDVPSRRHPLDGWKGDVSDEDAELMRRSIEDEFEQVNPDEWK